MQIASIAAAGNDILPGLKAANPNAQFIAVMDGPHRMIACVEQDRCYVFYVGDCTPSQKIELFAKIKARDVACTINTLLIDFSRFTGVIDWEYVKQQKNAAPGLEPPPSKVAYVVGSTIAGLFAKAILTYTKQQWQVFTACNEAAEWLGWNKSAPEL